MTAQGVNEPAMSEWTSPVVLLPETDGTPRFCEDYRKLIAKTIRDSYPIPRIDYCIDSSRGTKMFSTLYCNSGYWKIPTTEEDSDKTTSVSHMGSHRFTRMPLARQMDQLLFDALLILYYQELNDSSASCT